MNVDILDQIIKQNLTYLQRSELADLHEIVRRAEITGLKGDIIEAGCALGGSALALASAKRRFRRMMIFDTFGLIPPPSDRDDQDVHDRYATIINGASAGIGGEQYYDYRKNLLEHVKGKYVEFGIRPALNRVSFIKGLFAETMNIRSPVAVAHIDSDWFDSVTTCLQQIAPNLSVGGTMIMDDYGGWSGCTKAVDTYFADKMDSFEFIKKSKLHIVRTRPRA